MPAPIPSAPAPPRWSAIDILVAAAGVGLLTGILEAVAAAVRWRVMHVTLFMGPELVWHLPLTEAVVFPVLALPLVALGAAWPALRSPRLVLAVLFALLLFAALLLTEKIHIAAEAILALGAGVAIARALARREAAVRRLFRFGVPAALVLFAALAVGQGLVRRAGERNALDALPPAAAGRPNILVLVLDTVRAWSLSLYGYGRRTTPLLQQWAARGTVFQRALAPAPWTTLSHAVMFTGHYPTELGVSWRTPYDHAYPTLAEVLGGAGYATAGFAGNYLNVGRGTGLSAGFLHFEDYPLEPIHLLRSTTMGGRLLRIDRIKELVGRRRTQPSLPAPEVNRRFLDWLGRREGHAWFAFLNYFDAHGPYLPPPAFETMYMGKADPPVDRYWQNVQKAYGPPPVPIEALAEELDAYDGAITYLDQQVDSLLKALEARGQLQNTIVVVTSDHGELFGEHGVIGHGNNLYLPVLHVPLLIIAPGRVPAGASLPSLVSLRDLPATLADMAGLPPATLPGHSLTSAWNPEGGAAGVDSLLASVDYNWLIPRYPPSPVLRGPMRTVVLDSLQYILNGDGAEELYHLGTDSWEIRNLAAVPLYRADLARYRGALATLLRTARAPSPSR